MSEIVWEGADRLRPHLVPIDHLEPYPGNPRRGQIAEIASSLRRFGQVRAILTDGRTIVAGNHTWRAVRELGWTHIAAVANTFADAEEAKAYLIADNRLPEHGAYDEPARLDLLEGIEGSGAWEGTGYSPDDLEDLRALTEKIPVTAPEGFAGGHALSAEELAERARALASGRTFDEVVLLVDPDQHAQFHADTRILGHEYGEGGITAVVARAVREEALIANQG